MWDWHHPRTVTCPHKFQPSVKSFDWQLFSSGLNICSAFPWWSHHLWRTRLRPLLGWSNQKPGSPLPCCAKTRVSTNTHSHNYTIWKTVDTFCLLVRAEAAGQRTVKGRAYCHGPSLHPCGCGWKCSTVRTTRCFLPSKGGDFWEMRTFCLILSFNHWLRVRTWFERWEVAVGFRFRWVLG